MAAEGRPGDESAVTKVVARLDPDYERRLAAKAEAGFEPATLTRRHAGRPSLSDAPTTPSGSTAGSATSSATPSATPSTATPKQADQDPSASR